MGRIRGEIVLIHTIRVGERKWIGHTLRGDSLLRTVIEEKWRGGGQEEDRDK